jgi:hypothetical protein
MLVGFCCGGFSSTAGYVPGNEVQLSLNDFRYFRLDQFPKRNPFLSGRYSKPFGFGIRRTKQLSSARLLSSASASP